VALLKKAGRLGVQLHTSCAVHSINREDASQPWTLCTSKGKLLSSTVIHATNGYASALLPEITDKLVPCKGHAAAIVPPKEYHGSPLQTSFGFHWGEDFDDLIQRQRGAKHLVYGGRDLSAGCNPAIGIGDSDDSFVYPQHVKSLQQFPAETFKDWTRTGDRSPEAQVWSGIMGFVVDDLPYVGAIPRKPGQFICAGYNGSGMLSTSPLKV
jgi:glycine/D-amino acid oxidase-like deaminating enzyme